MKEKIPRTSTANDQVIIFRSSLVGITCVKSIGRASSSVSAIVLRTREVAALAGIAPGRGN